MIPELKFKSIGQFISSGEWIHPTSTLQSWEFIYMTEGEGHFLIGDERVDAVAGDMLLFPANISHGGYKKSLDKVSFIWMHVFADGKQADAYMKRLVRVLRSVGSTQIPVSIRQLLHRANHSAYPAEINDTCASLIAAEYELWSQSAADTASSAPLVNRIKEWIRMNSDRAITVADVAGEFSYNEDYITRYFVKRSGVSLKKHIDESRMNLLRTKLMTTDATLKTIASESGFDEYKSFLKFFTYHEGISPTEFRKSCYMTRTNNK